MIQTFGDQGTEDIYNGVNSKRASKILPAELHLVARRKLDLLNRARHLAVLKSPPNNRLEALTKDLMGFWSIRINDQYRIVFQWHAVDVFKVRITDYH